MDILFSPKTTPLDLKAILNVDVDKYLQGQGDSTVLENLYGNMSIAVVVSTEISKEHAIHAFHVAQLCMELKHFLWLDSEKSLEAEKANSIKLKSALQRATALLKERKETASILNTDVPKDEKEEFVRQIADYKDYIEKIEEEKRLLEADLDHLANELEKFTERGTNFHSEEILYLQNEKEKLEREIQYLETDLDRCKDSLNREKQAYADLQEELKTAKRNTLDMEDQVDNYKQEIMEYRRQLNDQNNRLASKNKDDRDVRAQLTLKEKESTKLAKRLAELEEEHVTLQTELKDLTEELMALGHENESLQREVHSTREAYSEAQDRVDDLEKEKEKLVNHLNLLEARVGDKNDDETFLAEIAVKVQKWKDLLDQKDKDIFRKDQELAKLQAILSSNQLEQQGIQALLQNRMTTDYKEASSNNLRAVIQEKDEHISMLAQQLKTMQSDMEILSLELVRMEDAEKAKILPQNRPVDENLKRKITDLENELNQERAKFRQEYFTVEEEKKEMITLRARMDEYERGVYGLAEATAELRQEKAKVKYREQDILKLTTTVNRLEQQILKYVEENKYLKQQTGISDVESQILTSKAKVKLNDQLEIERLRSLNSQLESEVAALEKERLQLKTSLRAQAFDDGERYLRLGLSKRDAALLDELITTKEHQIPENPEDMKKEIRRLMALIKRSSEAIQIAQLENQELKDKVGKLAAKKSTETPTPPSAPVLAPATKETSNAEVKELQTQHKQMTTEIEQMRSKLFQVTYENERKDATIRSLHEATITRSMQVPLPVPLKDTEGGTALENLNEQLIQCLEELCSKEQFIEEIEGQLRSYTAQFQTLTDQQHVLYEEHVRNKTEYHRQLEVMEKQVLTVKVQCDQYKIQAEEYSQALGEGSEDTLKGRISELTRRVVLLRADSETLQRRYSYLVLEFEAKTKELDKLKSEATVMERMFKERILFMELSNTRFSAKLEAQQALLDSAVPAADFEILSRKYALLSKQHEESLAREKSAIDYRIETEPLKQEVAKLTARILELDASLDVANQRALRFEELLHNDARFIASSAGSGIRIASLEAELTNAEKQTQLARSRERATNETHHELADRIHKLEAQVVEQVKRIHELSVSEAELRNQLVGTITRDAANQFEAQVASLKAEVSRLSVDLAKHKELAAIASAQSANIVANAESSTNELAQLRVAVRDLQAKGDQEHLLGELYQRVTVLQLSEASAQHKAEHYRSEYQRLSLSYHKLLQRVDEFLNRYFAEKEHHRTIIHEYHQRMDVSGGSVEKRWLDKHMQVMESYRSAEMRIAELLNNNRSLRERRAEVEERIPSFETEVCELKCLVETLRKGSLEADRIAEWGTQAITGKLELLALQRRIMSLQEHEAYLTRVQTTLEATIRRMEEQSIKEEFVWEQKIRTHHTRARELERRLLEKERMDDASVKSMFEQAKATELPSASLPLNERLESTLRQLEDAQKIIAAQNSTIINLNTNALVLNSKVRAQEDLVLDKESQIHDLNVSMARVAVAEASDLVVSTNAVIPASTYTTELRSLQTMYQFACNTIEGLRDMVASKEDTVLRYQQTIVQAREAHKRDRQHLEGEIQKLIERITTHEGDNALKEITEELRRIEQTPKPIPVESVVPSHEVDALLHAKQHELREMASQLEVARMEAVTTALQLESAIKQRDHWRQKYETDMDEIRAHHIKERELETTLDLAEKDSLRKESARLQTELSMLQHEVVKLKNELAAEVARTQLLDQEVQRAPSESVSRLVTQMRDQLNLKEKKLQTLQSAIAMLKQELVTASQTIAEKSIRENREELDKDSRNKNNKHKLDSSVITDEQVEPLIRRIAGLQDVITRMKEDHTTLARAEAQLRTQISGLQSERSRLAADSAKHERTARYTLEESKRCQLQLQDARDTIAILEKKLIAAMKPSGIQRPSSNMKSSEPSDQPRRSQTQLLRSRSKNNNPPTRPTPKFPKPASKPTKPMPQQVPATSQESEDESEYSLDFDDEDDGYNTPQSPTSKDNNVNSEPKNDLQPANAASTAQIESQEADDKLSEFFDEEFDSEEDSKKKANTGKNKDNKTRKLPKQPTKDRDEHLPPKAREHNSLVGARKDGKELPSKASTTKDNKNTHTKAEAENEQLRKIQAIAKWECEKKAQKQIDALKKKVNTLSTDLVTATQQAASLKEMLARVQTEKSALEHSYSLLKAKQEKEVHSPLSPSVEHVLQLKSQIDFLEGEVSRLSRIAQVEKVQQIAILQHELSALQERLKVSELLLNACRDDLGAKIPQQTKELTILVPKLQAEAHASSNVVLEKDNQIMELRFDKEELRRTVLRLQTRITDLELLSQLGSSATGSSTATNNKGREAELQGVITALRTVAERLKTENETLKKTAISSSKYMEVVKENKALKQKVAELITLSNAQATKDIISPSATAVNAENEQLKKRLKRETESNQKQLKIIEDHETAARDYIENTKKLNQAQRNLETALAIAQETIRKKDADLKSALLALEGEKANKETEVPTSSRAEQLEVQLIQKENDYLLLLNKLEAAETQNNELKNELSAFDEAFFVEIEELKNNYQKALELIAHYESSMDAAAATAS